MTLRRLLLSSALALSFTLSAPAVAKADPISAAIVTFVGFTGTAAAVATFVINSALYAAGSWAIGKAAQALGVGKMSVAERQASVTSLSLGETPREAIIGEACTGGSLIDAFYFGGKYGTDTTSRCILLADHECDALVGYYVDDQFYPWTGDGVQPGFNTKLSIEFYNARADGWDPPLHVRQNGGWTLADRNVGLTYVWVDTRTDDEVWTQGHPRLRFVLRGLKAYDPRRDAALGYTGPNPHVWSDPSTHQFTRNAAVLRYNYQRGVFATGRHGQIDHLLIGRGLSAEEAPPERIISAANICDEMVDGEVRYAANGVISAAQDFIEVEEMFAAAMAGVIIQPEGGVEVEPGHAKAVEVTITDDDLVVGENVVFSNFLPDTAGGRTNTVIPRYVSPAQGWKDFGGPPRRDLADLTEDGGPREVTLPLMLVTSGKQADRCAEIARRRGRLERRASIPLPPDFSGIEEGDWVAWQSDRYHDGATVRYQVVAFGLDEKWRMRLSLEEVASSVYGVPDPIEERAEPPTPPIPVDALQLYGVTVESVTLAGETSTLPAIRFRWDVVTNDTAMIAIRAEVRRVGETDAAPTRFEDVAKGEMTVTNGVGPDMALEARLVPIGDPSRPIMPTNWVTVSTATVKAGEADNALALNGTPAAEITGRLADAEGLVAATSMRVDELTDVVESATGEFGQALILVGQQVEAAEGFAQASDSRATAAAASAGEALTYRNQTSSIRDDTITARDEARTSAKASSDQAAALLYSRFNSPETWTNTEAAGGPVADLATTTWPIVIDPDLGPCLEITSSSYITVTHKGFVLGVGRQHRLRLKAKCITPAGTAAPAFRDARLNAALGYLTRGSLNQPFATAGQIVDWTQDVNTSQRMGFTAGAENCRFGFSCNGTWRLALFSVEDITESSAAAAEAATALIQASSAGASAASAAINANVAAQVGGGSMNQNPTFAAWSGALPDSYGILSAADGTITKVAGLNGQPNAVRMASNSTAAFGMNQFTLAASPGGDWLVVAVEFTLVAGNLQGSGLEMITRTASATAVSNPVNFGQMVGAGVVGKTYRLSKLVDGRHVNADRYAINMRARLASMSPVGAVTLEWHKAAFRVATPEEVAAGTELPAMGAQAALALSVATDAQTKLSEAQFSATAQAGGDPGQVYVKAGPLGSVAGFIASSIKLATVVGGSVIEVVKVIGTSAHFAGKVFIGALQEITLDPTLPGIIWKIGGATLVIGKLPNQNLVFWFGPTVAIASMTKANSTFWLDSVGNAYFGGTLSAGMLTNKIQASTLAQSAETETAFFGSNGGTITVVASGNYSSYAQRRSATNPGAASGTNGPTVLQLHRKLGAAAYAVVGTINVTGTWNREVVDFNDDHPSGRYQITTSSSASGAITYTDPTLSTTDRQYKLVVTSRANLNGAGVGASTSERMSIIATE